MPSTLLGALQDFQEETAVRIVPAERAVLLLGVSRAVRAAMERVRPVARVTAKRGQGIDEVEDGLRAMSPFFRVTALDLSFLRIGADGTGRLAAVLGQCPSLAHLHLDYNGIGDEGAGWLTKVLGHCPSLTRLDLGFAGSGADGAERLAETVSIRTLTDKGLCEHERVRSKCKVVP